MIKSSAKSILNRKPKINFVQPRSGLTIPQVPLESAPLTPKAVRVNQIIQGLENIALTAEAVEGIIAERAKNEVLKLDLTTPEDAVVAQAAARQFPEKAVNINGFVHVPEITFQMFHHCMKAFKAAGIAAGAKQEIKQTGPIKADKTDFGGQGKDKRPDVNKSTIPFAPIDLPAFIAAGIPLLFGLLFPLINLAVKKDIVGHTHLVPPPAGPAPAPSGPGMPVFS